MYMDDDDWFWIGIVILVLIIVGTGTVIADTVTSKEIATPTGDYLIQSLHENSEIHGTFSIGSGYVGESRVFIYYQQVGTGLMEKTCPAEHTIIYEDENDHPFIREIDDYRSGGILGIRSGKKTLYELHVPAGTVVKVWRLGE
jgi:hypothetical protein